MILSVENLSFRYPDVPVLHGITFGVNAGDFLSLLGPNGSGKSTLLRLLDRILLPQSGTITLVYKSGKKIVWSYKAGSERGDFYMNGTLYARSGPANCK